MEAAGRNRRGAAKKQAEILQSYASMVKEGGTLVYATCSILPSENEKQVAGFLEANPQFKLEEENGRI